MEALKFERSDWKAERTSLNRPAVAVGSSHLNLLEDSFGTELHFLVSL